MEKPDFALLHGDIKSGNPIKILSDLEDELSKILKLEELKQYFYDFLDYIVKFGNKELESPIRDVIDHILKENKLYYRASIFVALSACSCTYKQFMDNTFKILTPYKEYLVFETKDAVGFEGYKYNIFKETVMIEVFRDEELKYLVEDRKFFTNFTNLKTYLWKKFGF